VTTELF